jgi:hypothetical protein
MSRCCGMGKRRREGVEMEAACQVCMRPLQACLQVLHPLIEACGSSCGGLVEQSAPPGVGWSSNTLARGPVDTLNPLLAQQAWPPSHSGCAHPGCAHPDCMHLRFLHTEFLHTELVQRRPQQN